MAQQTLQFLSLMMDKFDLLRDQAAAEQGAGKPLWRIDLPRRVMRNNLELKELAGEILKTPFSEQPESDFMLLWKNKEFRAEIAQTAASFGPLRWKFHDVSSLDHLATDMSQDSPHLLTLESSRLNAQTQKTAVTELLKDEALCTELGKPENEALKQRIDKWSEHAKNHLVFNDLSKDEQTDIMQRRLGADAGVSLAGRFALAMVPRWYARRQLDELTSSRSLGGTELREHLRNRIP